MLGVNASETQGDDRNHCKNSALASQPIFGASPKHANLHVRLPLSILHTCKSPRNAAIRHPNRMQIPM